jgi:hypothetical protein
MSQTSDKPDLAFVHLSDIHFRAGEAGDLHDLDEELRNEVELDLRTANTLVPRIDGMFFTGDIAFGAGADEYNNLAAPWIESIRESVDCPRDGVLVTPGNHDVDRKHIAEGSEIAVLHDEIRAAPTTEERDRRVARLLRDPTNGATLFRPLATYNAFATAYGCAVSPSTPYWTRNFPMREGTTLRIRGITSTITSGPHDDLHPNQLVYGGAQRRFLRTPNVRYGLLAHHPPSWTLEGDTAEHDFVVRTIFQLYGHRHAQWFAPLGNSLRLIAGAVHPDRREPNWRPRYNIVTLTTLDPTHIRIRIFPRKWSDEQKIFAPDFLASGQAFREHVVTVDPPEHPTSVAVVHDPSGPDQGDPTLAQTPPGEPAEAKLIGRLERLGEDLRGHLIRTVLIPLAVDGNPTCAAIVRSAAEAGRLAALWSAVTSQLGDDATNPFVNERP